MNETIFSILLLPKLNVIVIGSLTIVVIKSVANGGDLVAEIDIVREFHQLHKYMR